MRSDDFGPVPVSRVRNELPAIREALADGRRVLISRRGVVFSVIEPATSVPEYLLATHAAGMSLLAELPSRTLGQGLASPEFIEIGNGAVRFFSDQRRILGVARAITPIDRALDHEARRAGPPVSELLEQVAGEGVDPGEATLNRLAALQNDASATTDVPTKRAADGEAERLAAEANQLDMAGDSLGAAHKYAELLVRSVSEFGRGDEFTLTVQNNLVVTHVRATRPSVMALEALRSVYEAASRGLGDFDKESILRNVRWLERAVEDRDEVPVSSAKGALHGPRLAKLAR